MKIERFILKNHELCKFHQQYPLSESLDWPMDLAWAHDVRIWKDAKTKRTLTGNHVFTYFYQIIVGSDWFMRILLQPSLGGPLGAIRDLNYQDKIDLCGKKNIAVLWNNYNKITMKIIKKILYIYMRACVCNYCKWSSKWGDLPSGIHTVST